MLIILLVIKIPFNHLIIEIIQRITYIFAIYYPINKHKIMETGLKHVSTVTVSAANTALTIGSGDMEVFATPAMVALMENAAMKAVAPHLPEGSTTVGAMMETSHIKPSALGETVNAEAILEEIDGRKLTFKVTASDSKGTIGEGKHIRYIVDRERFLSKLK